MALTRPRLLWPITVETGVNDTIRLTASDMGGAQDATITAGDWYVSGDGTASDLLAEVVTRLNAACVAGGGAANFSAVVSTTGTITISRAVGTFTILWATTPVGAPFGVEMGFTSDRATVASMAGDVQHESGWYPERYLKSYEGALVERVGAASVAVSGRVRVHELAVHTTHHASVEHLPLGKIRTGEAGYTNEALQALWADPAAVADFRFYSDVTSTSYVRAAIADPTWIERLVDDSVIGGASGGATRLQYPAVFLYEARLPLRLYV